MENNTRTSKGQKDEEKERIKKKREERKKREKETPTVGLEPTTTRLRALRSTDWARRASYHRVTHNTSHICLSFFTQIMLFLQISNKLKTTTTHTIPYHHPSLLHLPHPPPLSSHSSLTHTCIILFRDISSLFYTTNQKPHYIRSTLSWWWHSYCYSTSAKLCPFNTHTWLIFNQYVLFCLDA